MWRNVGHSKRTANAGGASGWGNGRRIVLYAGLTCIVGMILYLATLIARIMAPLRRIEISTARAR